MPYCLFDKNTKEYLGGQLHCPPEPYDKENHVVLVLDEYPERSCKLADDLVSVRKCDENELDQFKEAACKQYCEAMKNNHAFFALVDVIFDVSNGQKYADRKEFMKAVRNAIKKRL